MKHLDLMVKGYSLRTVARKLNIALSTAFYWRHKVLNGLRSLPLEEFEGVTEADEMYFLESQKGRRRIPHRKPRKRGGVAKSRGLSRDQICVFVGRDRNRNTQARVAGTGQMSKARAAHLLDEGVAHVTVLCTDSAGAYRKFAESKNIPHYSLNASKKERVLKGIYHIQNVNAFQSRLRQWILRFKGVSTKHLDNYLAWFHFLDDHGTEALQPKIRTLLLAACEKPVVQSYVSIKNTPLNLPA